MDKNILFGVMLILTICLSAGVSAAINLSVTKDVMNDGIPVNNTMTFVINITNIGTENITNWMFEDGFNSSSINFTAASILPTDFNQTSGYIDWYFNLSNGSSQIIFVNFTTLSEGDEINYLDSYNSSGDSTEFIASANYFIGVATGPQCWLYDDNSSQCNVTANCTWNPLGFCDIDCIQKSNTNQSECESQFDGVICSWDNATGDCTPKGFDDCFNCHENCTIYENDSFECHDSCENQTFCLGDGGMIFNDCFINDGKKDSCILDGNCTWMPDSNGPSYNGTESGWCNPAGMDFTGDNQCWQYDGDQTGCEGQINFGAPCTWTPDSWYSGPGDDAGWCDDIFGGDNGCWNNPDEASCNASADMGMPCTWTPDNFSASGGWCEQKGCWNYDGNETQCTNISLTILNCSYDNVSNFCYENFGNGCSNFDGDEFGCYGTGFCFWDSTGNGTCNEPTFFDPSNFFNPGCWIFDQAGLAGDTGKCNNVTVCDWTGSFCNETQSLDKGIQCSDINNSEMCNNIPMLSNCCSWNGTGCQDAPFTTACWDNMKEPPEGAMFCEDYKATSNETLCKMIAGDPWYMPCEWDNSTEKCGFTADNLFGGDAKNFDFMDIGSQSNCEATGGVWKSEKYTDNGIVYTDNWCEMNFGMDRQTCNDSCWACEQQDDGSDWANLTMAQLACENSAAFNSSCVFHADNNSWNRFGWCDMNMSSFNQNYSAFSFEDCMGFVDADGDGLLPAEDPDCMDFMKSGYIEAETGIECSDNIDNDGNGLTDCDDFGCMYDPYYCNASDYANDTNPPTVTWMNIDKFKDGAFISVDTNKPTNATLLFYYNDSACATLNQTILDWKLENDWDFDDYDVWHDFPVDRIYFEGKGITNPIDANTTYYFKTILCDKSGNCAESACTNFTTLSAYNNYTIGFDLPPPQSNVKAPLGKVNVKFDWNGDGTFDANITGNTGHKINETQGRDVDLKFENPNATDPWAIEFKGADFLKAQSLNITDAFIVNDTTGNGDYLVGMKKDKWDELAQKLGVDSVNITLPEGIPANTSTHKYTGKLKHCPDNATSADDSRCINITMTDVDCTFTTNSTTCNIPTSIGFSVFAVFMAEAITEVSTSTSSSGGGGSGGAAPTATATNPSQTQIWDEISAGTTNTMTLDKEDIAFTEIAMDVTNALADINLKVETIATENLVNNKPEAVDKAAAGKVYQYIHIKETNIQSSDVSKAMIKFKVKRSWLTENGIDSSEIVLARFSNNKWDDLKTTQTGSDATNIDFEAESPGLSYYAIRAESPNEPTPVTENIGESTTTAAGENKTEQETLEKAPINYAWIGIAIVVAVLIVYLLWPKKKKKK